MRFARAVWRLVRRVPRGRVVTYGQIAELLGRPRAARRVGWALRICPLDLPWHRVVNAQGGISVRGGASRRPAVSGAGASGRRTRRPGGCGTPALDSMTTQRLRLAAEGVTLRRGRVALERHRWRPSTS